MHGRSADRLALKPGNLSQREAATSPLVLLTAREAMWSAHRPDRKMGLVHGVAGGIANMAAKIALTHNAHLYITVSTDKRSIPGVWGYACQPRAQWTSTM